MVTRFSYKNLKKLLLPNITLGLASKKFCPMKNSISSYHSHNCVLFYSAYTISLKSIITLYCAISKLKYEHSFGTCKMANKKTKTFGCRVNNYVLPNGSAKLTLLRQTTLGKFQITGKIIKYTVNINNLSFYTYLLSKTKCLQVYSSVPSTFSVPNFLNVGTFTQVTKVYNLCGESSSSFRLLANCTRIRNDQTNLFNLVSMRTSCVPICWVANLRISLIARGARFLKPMFKSLLCIRIELDKKLDLPESDRKERRIIC
ncbi:hypothetical protein AGLY_007194 [Aphis glycines]|uniref:Uncharacterized protein n=1 Tax=Aphis glycines TaxID=307491 RepID=A0A6G0TPC1_APHGL|nr:hypothetical protein AGLY_007194 [Aphis glycines]